MRRRVIEQVWVPHIKVINLSSPQMVHRVIENGVTVAEYEKVLCIPGDFSKLSVLSQDGTTAEELSHFVAHVIPIACCSWPGSILSLVFGLPSWCILKGLRSTVGSHLCGDGHLKVLPHHSDGI